MNAVDFILAGIIILAASLAAIRLISNKRHGRGSCSCGTGACGGCPVKEKKKSKK